MPEPNEQINKDDGLTGDEGIDQSSGGIDEILEEAPIVDTNPSEIVPDESGESPEATATDTDTNQDDSTESTEEGTPTEDGPTIELDGKQYTQEQLSQALKVSDGYNEWEKRLRSESQVLKGLNEDQIKMLVAYAKGQKEIPADADPAVALTNDVMKSVFETDTITIKDTEGLDQEIPISAIAPFIENIVKTVSGKYTPVIQNLEKTVVESRQEYVTGKIQQFMTEKPEFRVLVPEGLSLKEHLDNVSETGEMHPDHKTVSRFEALLDVMQAKGFKTLDETYSFMYGKSQDDLK
jgi:hypothetical protein